MASVSALTGGCQEAFDPAMALALWKKIKTKASHLVIEPEPLTGDANADGKLLANRQVRTDWTLSTVNQKTIGWGGTL